jgi:S-formylglutathione hydrolase FrmB
MKVISQVAVICMGIIISCATPQPRYQGTISSGNWLRNISVPYSGPEGTFSVPVQIFFPKGYKKGDNYRTIILLPDYGSSLREWEKNSAVETLATSYKCVLICPQMGISMYASKFHPETQRKWNPLPGGIWIGTVLLPYIQDQFALCHDKGKTAIMGVSDGGRGALLVAEQYPQLFGAAVAISGFYDNQLMTRYRPLRYLYGEYKKFKDRWQTEDNVIAAAEKLENIAVYVVHSTKDPVISPGQAMLLAIKINHLLKNANLQMNFKYAKRTGYEHDWKYWRRFLPEIFTFLNKNLDQ